MPKILALDVGEKRVGCAISDESFTMAFPRETFVRKPIEKFIGKLRDLIRSERIIKIVIGLPLGEDNEETSPSKRIRDFGSLLARTLMLPIDYVDEFNSTKEALAIMPFRKERRLKGQDDVIAAHIILQRYLEDNRGQ